MFVAIVALIFAILAPAHGAGIIRHPHECNIQDLHHARFGRWSNQQNLSRPFNVFNPSVEPGRIRHDEGIVFIGDDQPNCSSLPGTNVFTPLNDGALCPWYLQMDTDSRRIPVTLPMAKCSCEQVQWGGVTFECHTVQYQVRVLQFAAEDCNEVEEKEVPVNVGCVAVRQAKEPNPRHTHENEFMLARPAEKRFLDFQRNFKKTGKN